MSSLSVLAWRAIGVIVCLASLAQATLVLLSQSLGIDLPPIARYFLVLAAIPSFCFGLRMMREGANPFASETRSF